MKILTFATNYPDSLPAPFAGSCIGNRALTTNRQSALMTETSVATNALKSLQIICNGSSQVSFDHDLLIYDMVADKTKFLLVQLLGSPIRINTRFLEYLFGASGSNAVNVTQRIFYLLAIWYINS